VPCNRSLFVTTPLVFREKHRQSPLAGQEVWHTRGSELSETQSTLALAAWS
jgi:hypothetical protein